MLRRADTDEQPEPTEEDYQAWVEHVCEEERPDVPFELHHYIHTPLECWNTPRPPNIVPDLAFERSVGVIVSEPHVGKTLILLDLALALASGQPWIAWRPARPVPSLVYALDSPGWESSEQARNLMAGRGLDPRITTTTIPCAVACREQIRREFGRFDILNKRCFSHAVDTARGIGAKFIGLDSLSKLHNKEENDRASMEEVMSALEALAERTGAHVLVMHHTPVGGRQNRTAYAGRGSSVIAASVDLELHLMKRRGGQRVMDVLKARGSDISDHRFTLALERVEHPEVPRAVKWVIVPEVEPEAGRPRGPTETTMKVRAGVLAVLEGGPKKRSEIAEYLVQEGLAEVQSSYSITNGILSALARENIVHSPKRGVWEVADGGSTATS